MMAVGSPAVHLSRVFQGSFCFNWGHLWFLEVEVIFYPSLGVSVLQTGLSGKTLEPGTCRSGGRWDGMTPLSAGGRGETSQIWTEVWFAGALGPCHGQKHAPQASARCYWVRWDRVEMSWDQEEGGQGECVTNLGGWDPRTWIRG